MVARSGTERYFMPSPPHSITAPTPPLTESILKSGGETIYDALQTGLEILAAGDETFEDVFTLPDGSVPFQE